MWHRFSVSNIYSIYHNFFLITAGVLLPSPLPDGLCHPSFESYGDCKDIKRPGMLSSLDKTGASEASLPV